MNAVIDSVTKIVLRAGNCGFDFDPAIETFIESSFIFNKSLEEAIWKYDEQQDTFIEDFLAVKKMNKTIDVHAKTMEDEGLGVPYNNYRFSITPSAKSNWLAVVMVRDTLTYPFNAPTGFGSIYPFQNANDVLGFFGASMAYLQYWEQSDEQFVMAIAACTTVEQVDAIVDDRSYPPA